jgi:hypothetical protein
MPNAQVGATAFGTITGMMANSSPRRLQVAVKFTY